MVKKLHRLIIGAYIGPLLVTFVIVLFILSMQFLWKYVDDLMGKGLPWYTLTELMFYATASFVPMAIPLAVLLSSIMTMGGLGEHSELTPMRSAGLGLSRIMAPLFIFTLGIAGFSFYFSNNLLPMANLRFQSLLWDVTQKKPALNLKPGVFYNGLEGFSIRIAAKNEDTGLLEDVLIYDHRQAFQSNRTVLRAERGRMKRSADSHYLILELENGRVYDEQMTGRDGKAGNKPLLRGSFERDEVRIDMSGLGLKRTDTDLFKDHFKMLTLGQLQIALDSLTAQDKRRTAEEEFFMHNAYSITRDTAHIKPPSSFATTERAKLMRDPKQRVQVYQMAQDVVRGHIRFLDEQAIPQREERRETIAKHRIEQHRKPMLAFACLLFFFIGAPLGAIVRKGGMGLPTVFAIVFFLIFFIVTNSTEQIVRTGQLGAWPGMWISTLVLLPVGLILTWKAANDSPLMDSDAYARWWDNLRARFLPRRAHPTALQ